MESIKAPRGVRDILPEQAWKWAYVLEMARSVSEDFAYRETHLPIFEQTDLFSRGIGDTTDVVEKEMYTFEDRAGRSLTLRPELTASMVRAYLEHQMHRQPQQPAKLWSYGPMFRYERPQKGRYRQFWQLDVEAIGVLDPLIDVEIIAYSLELFRRLGLKNLEVVINSVGCEKCRPTYRQRLREYLEPRLSELCDTCRDRYDRNPLRILDCKRPGCKAATEEAPEMLDSLCDECAGHFDAVRRGLERIGAHCILDKRLVRGLDYYTKTAYEVLSGDLGAQNAVCGGGRYDNLAEAIGGPHVPGVGFAAGLDRIVLTMEQQGADFGEEPHGDVYVVVPEESARIEGAGLLHSLRMAGISADMDHRGRSMKAQLKLAAEGSAFACILGGGELERGVCAVKDLREGSQSDIPLDQVARHIAAQLADTRNQGKRGNL